MTNQIVSGNASRILEDLARIDEGTDGLYDLIASIDDLVPDSQIKEMNGCVDRIICAVEDLGRGLNIRKEWVVQEEDTDSFQSQIDAIIENTRESDLDLFQELIDTAVEYTRESDRQIEEERKERESDPYIPNDLEEARVIASKFRGARAILVSGHLWKSLRDLYRARVDDLRHVMKEDPEITEDGLHNRAFEMAVLELIDEKIITGEEIINKIRKLM